MTISSNYKSRYRKEYVGSVAPTPLFWSLLIAAKARYSVRCTASQLAFAPNVMLYQRDQESRWRTQHVLDFRNALRHRRFV